MSNYRIIVERKTVYPDNNIFKFDYTQFKNESIAILGFSVPKEQIGYFTSMIVKLFFWRSLS